MIDETPGLRLYDPTKDPVMLATCARVKEAHARAWVAGAPIEAPVREALEKAAASLKNLIESEEYEEVLEDIRRFRRIPPIRRLEINDEMIRSDMAWREAYRRAVGRA